METVYLFKSADIRNLWLVKENIVKIIVNSSEKFCVTIEINVLI